MFNISRLVKDMTGAITTLKPINGYLTFQPDVTSQRLAVATVDDNVPEPEQQFAVALLSPKGGAVLDENHARAILSGMQWQEVVVSDLKKAKEGLHVVEQLKRLCQLSCKCLFHVMI